MAVYKRGKVWYINLTLGGVRIQKPAGPTKRQAIEAQEEIRSRYRRKELHIEDLQRSVPFSYAARRYLDHVAASRSKRTAELDATDYRKHLAPHLAALSLPDIDNDLLLRFQASQKKAGYANRTVNIHMGLIRKILRHAHQLGITGTVRLNFPMLREPRKTHAFITADKLRAFLTELSKSGMAYYRTIFGICTGLRPAELAFLAWQDVDLNARICRITSKPPAFVVKTGVDRIIPLNPTALKILQELSRQKRGPWVFSFNDRPVRSIRRALATASEAAGLTRKITQNMLRHTFATYALMHGADVRSVQAVLGHENLETTLRYTHALSSQTRKAVDLITLPMRTPTTKLLQKKKAKTQKTI